MNAAKNIFFFSKGHFNKLQLTYLEVFLSYSTILVNFCLQFTTKCNLLATFCGELTIFILNIYMKEELTLGSKLKHYRVVAKLSQQEVADKLGVDRVTYSKYENNKTVPPFDLMVRFSKLMNVDISAFASKQESITALNLSDQDMMVKIDSLKNIEDVKAECHKLIKQGTALRQEIANLEKDMLKIIRDLR